MHNAGSSAAVADLTGSLNLLGSASAGATVSNAQPLWIDRGTLAVTGASNPPGNTITGSISVVNAGSMTVGTAAAPSYRTLSAAR